MAVGALALAIVAALVVMALARTHGAHGSIASAATRRAQPGSCRRRRSPAPTRSPIGLPLGRPPLALTGIGDPRQDPVHAAFQTPPRAGLLFNLDTGQVLWQRNPYARLRIASLTKMMTALLTVESAPPDAPVLVTSEAVDMPGSKVGVLPLGRHVRLESMLYGLLLPSGNDAAVALAEHVAGSVNRVRDAHERRGGRSWGWAARTTPRRRATTTSTTSPAPPTWRCSRTSICSQPRIASITRTYTAALPFPIEGGKLYLYNNNPLLIYRYPGLTGLKTGYTEAAGRCLVATAERDGVRLGVVLLHSPDPGTQASYLLNRGFEGVYHQPPVPEPPIPAGE